MSRRPYFSSWLYVVAICGWLASEAGAQSERDSQKAAARVRRALEYGVEGESDFRNIMLRAALEADPQHVPANWHSGHVRQDDGWLAVADAQQQAVFDETLSKYRELRATAYSSPTRLLHLARWCARSGLGERSELHYSQLLVLPSTDAKARKEALHRLGLRQVGGRLMTDKQWKDHQQAEVQHGRAMDRWQPQLLKWHKAIEAGNSAQSAYASQQMLAVDDPSIVPVLRIFLPAGGNRFGVQIVQLLAGFPEHDATQLLAQFAVLSPSVGVRNAALGALKSRPLHDYAPTLLSWLSPPVQSQWRLYRDRLGNIRYEHVAATEGAGERQVFAVERVGVGLDPVVDWQLVDRPTNDIPTFYTPLGVSSALEKGTIRAGDRVNTPLPIGIRREQTGQETRVAAAMLAQAMKREKQLRTFNAMVAASNSRVFQVLEQATGAAVARDPIDWWTWWDNYNELYKPPKRTRFAIDSGRVLLTRSLGTQLYRSQLRTAGCSCFVAGTPVWTELGLTPIEIIEVGDRVLSQDPESGELAFKLVTAKTLRPPAPLTQIAITGEQILTTKGHPMWVVDKGWRMAKFIEVEQYLHGIEGGTMVQDVELLGREEEAHNLVVADFSTYFVGNTGVLVHDNTYRKPTRALVPGLVQE